jgi:hypothetical protein
MGRIFADQLYNQRLFVHVESAVAQVSIIDALVHHVGLLTETLKDPI